MSPLRHHKLQEFQFPSNQDQRTAESGSCQIPAFRPSRGPAGEDAPPRIDEHCPEIESHPRLGSSEEQAGRRGRELHQAYKFLMCRELSIVTLAGLTNSVPDRAKISLMSTNLRCGIAISLLLSAASLNAQSG